MGLKQILCVVLFFGAVSIARAETLTFTGSGTDDFSFQMSSTPTPYYFNSGNTAITVPVATPSGPVNYSFVFYNGGYGGAFYDYHDGASYTGAQVYSGSEANPVFSPSVFSFAAYGGDGSIVETLTIAAPIPEPSSFLLLFTGLGAVGFVAVRKGRPAEAIRLA